jgi:hypothetical protein
MRNTTHAYSFSEERHTSTPSERGYGGKRHALSQPELHKSKKLRRESTLIDEEDELEEDEDDISDDDNSDVQILEVEARRKSKVKPT